MDPKGYHLAETEPLKLLRIVRNGGPRDKLVYCRPLDRSRTLFRIFATSATTPEGLLKFVQRYGPITLEGNEKGDLVGYAIRKAQLMQDTLRWHARQRGSDKPSLDSVTLHARLDWDEKGSLSFKLRPNSLVDGLWLQFAQEVTRGVHIRACKHCGDLFETGVGTGRRLDAKFCSDKHRIAFNSLARSKEK